MRAINHAGRQARPRCLVVEDSRFDQERFRRILKLNFAAMEVVLTARLSEARTAMQDQAFALVLLDNNLPDGSGCDFALELAESHAGLPVLMVSDFPTPFMFAKARAAGVAGVIDKIDFTAGSIRAALAAA